MNPVRARLRELSRAMYEQHGAVSVRLQLLPTGFAKLRSFTFMHPHLGCRAVPGGAARLDDRKCKSPH